MTSFLWLYQSFERHSLLDKPRLSAFLVLLLSSLISFGASFFSEWLPGADGRFDDGAAIFDDARPILPKRPRRFFLPVLVACIVLRLEAFHRVNHDLQCSAAGVEVSTFLRAKVVTKYDRRFSLYSSSDMSSMLLGDLPP